MDPLAAYLPRLHARWLSEGGAPSWAWLDGSTVFADISGFTALSERLARRGKAGAEVLTDVVNDVMGRLLSRALALGGDLLKYGGDALLLLFTGGGHEERAATAARAMQAELRRPPAWPAGVGRATLRMSIGADAGPVLACLAGRSHRELVVVGPVLTGVAALEARAEAGQVLVGPALAAGLPPAWLGPAKGDGPGRLLRRAATDGGAAAAVGRDADGAVGAGPLPPGPLAAGIPGALRPHLGTAADGEHRQAVVAFLQFRGSDDLLAAEGPGAVADALDGLVGAVQAACEAHGVTFLTTDLDRNGGKVILAAGVPTTTGDDEDRMVSAVREILGVEHRLALRAGVNRGRLFAVEVGTAERRVYTVMGDAVNLAARVMGAAPVGGCLATVAVADGLAADYEQVRVEPFRVKGRSEPVSAVVVGEARGARVADGGGRAAPLVGRQAELSVLLAAVDDARAGRSRVVELSGEPGIGKSRLLAEARAAAGDLAQLVVEGTQYASTTPYRAVREAARSLLGLGLYDGEDVVRERLAGAVRDTAPELEPWLPLVAIPLGVVLPDTAETAALAPAFRRRRLEDATVALWSALLPRTGVLVAEDAHWLDEASTALLRRLVDRLLEGSSWAVLVARRAVPTALDLSEVAGLVRLELGPLPPQEAAGLVSAGADLGPAEAAALAERSGGNPLFLQELAAAAARGTAVDELPDRVESLIAARIDRLGPGDRSLLRVASVLGARFPTDLLATLAGDDRAVAAALRRGIDGLLVADGDQHRFRHALVREVAYEGLPFKRRRQLHGRAAELVEAYAAGAEAASEALSLHYFAAGRHPEAWRWSRVAGDRARRQAAPVEAAAFFERALESARHAGVEPAAVADTNEALGDVCELGGRYERAATAYRRARRLAAGDPVRTGNLLRKEGWVNERAGRYREALRWYTKGFRAVEGVGPSAAAGRLEAELYLAYGAVRVRQGRHREAVPLLEEAVRQAEALGARTTLAHAYYDLDWAWTELGTPDPRYRRLALPIFEELGDWEGQGSTLNNLGLGAYYEGRWDEALDYWRRARAAFQRAGDVVQEATIANNIGEILSDQGRLDAAEREFRTALATWRAARFRVGIGLALSNLGRVAARRGELAEAGGLLATAAAQLREIGANELACEADAREAERRLMAGDAEGALAAATTARQQANRPTLVAQLERTIGYAWAQRGDRDAAQEWLARSLATAERAGARFEAALTREAMVAVGVGDGDLHTAAPEAAATFGRLDVVWRPLPPLPGVVGAPG